jgi:hypothetical protein
MVWYVLLRQVQIIVTRALNCGHFGACSIWRMYTICLLFSDCIPEGYAIGRGAEVGGSSFQNITNLENCIKNCETEETCHFFTWNKPTQRCFLKTKTPYFCKGTQSISGQKGKVESCNLTTTVISTTVISTTVISTTVTSTSTSTSTSTIATLTTTTVTKGK